MAAAFVARFPYLFHVTEGTALAGIREHGLRSAAWLIGHYGAPLSLIEENRPAWTRVLEVEPPPVILRRQGMRESSLQSRLHPSITARDWRRFINDRVFFFADEKKAIAFRNAEKARCQVLLVFETALLAGVGVEMTACPFNNGYIDRSPADLRRLRHYADYHPVTAWKPGERVQEVAIPCGLPRGLSFEVR